MTWEKIHCDSVNKRRKLKLYFSESTHRFALVDAETDVDIDNVTNIRIDQDNKSKQVVQITLTDIELDLGL